MELADVVQEGERGKSLAVCVGQISLGRRRQAIRDDGGVHQSQEDSRDIHRVMRERAPSFLFVGFTPGGEPHGWSFKAHHAVLVRRVLSV